MPTWTAETGVERIDPESEVGKRVAEDLSQALADVRARLNARLAAAAARGDHDAVPEPAEPRYP